MFSYQFHIRDYLTKTRHLSIFEDLAYRRLIDAYYTEEQPLPADIQACARLIAMRDHADAVEAVLREFFLLTDAGWTNARCDTEITKYRSHQERGRRAASSRWVNAPSMNHQCIDAQLMPTSNQKPETKKPKTNKPKAVASSSAFRFVWETETWDGADRMIPVWEAAYPTLDIQSELAKARAWVIQNPAKSAGVKNWAQFFGGWLRRSATAMPQVGATPVLSNTFEGLA